MSPSLESLRIFETCVSAGSFAKAAERLSLSPAAVSLRIRSLEAELGRKLFVRKGPKVEPTAAAVALARSVKTTMDEQGGALDKFNAQRPALRVTAPPTFAARWLVQRLQSYFACDDSVEIDLDVSTDVRAAGGFDVAIRTGRGGWPGLAEIPLSAVSLTPMASPRLMKGGAEFTPQDLCGFPLLPHPSWPRWFEKAIGDVPAHLQFTTIDYPTHELNASAALAGQGVALLPPKMFAALLIDGSLVAPFEPTIEGPEWHCVLFREGDNRVAVKAFCDWIVEQTRIGL